MFTVIFAVGSITTPGQPLHFGGPELHDQNCFCPLDLRDCGQSLKFKKRFQQKKIKPCINLETSIIKKKLRKAFKIKAGFLFEATLIYKW